MGETLRHLENALWSFGWEQVGYRYSSNNMPPLNQKAFTVDAARDFIIREGGVVTIETKSTDPRYRVIKIELPLDNGQVAKGTDSYLAGNEGSERRAWTGAFERLWYFVVRNAMMRMAFRAIHDVLPSHGVYQAREDA